MNEEKMLSRTQDSVGYIVFNNPEKHNAVSIEKSDEISKFKKLDLKKVSVALLPETPTNPWYFRSPSMFSVVRCLFFAILRPPQWRPGLSAVRLGCDSGRPQAPTAAAATKIVFFYIRFTS